MNNKGSLLRKVICFIILLAVIIGLIFVILVSNKVENKSSSSSVLIEKTTVDDYSVSLDKIFSDSSFSDNMSIEKKYKGTTYYLKCNTLSDVGVCTNGSVLLNIEDVLYPIFTVEDDSTNYFMMLDNYYVTVNRNNVFIFFNDNGNGILKIFDRQGTLLNLVENILSIDYQTGEELKPSITYYDVKFRLCVDMSVYNYSIDLKEPILLHKNELLDGKTCN